MILAIGGDEMINNIDYTKLAMAYQSDNKAEIDPTLRSQVWGSLLVGLSAFCASLHYSSGLLAPAKAVYQRKLYFIFQTKGGW